MKGEKQMIPFIGGVVIGTGVGVFFGSRIAAEVKAGFALVSQTLESRIAAIEAAVKAKL